MTQIEMPEATIPRTKIAVQSTATIIVAAVAVVKTIVADINQQVRVAVSAITQEKTVEVKKTLGLLKGLLSPAIRIRMTVTRMIVIVVAEIATATTTRTDGILEEIETERGTIAVNLATKAKIRRMMIATVATAKVMVRDATSEV